MLWAPLSELPAIGRSPIYIFTLIIFVFFNFGVIYADNYGMLMAFRFLTGFFGSPVLATGAASMGDIWGPRTRDYMIGIWGSFAVAAPVLGPLIGGFAFSAYGWLGPVQAAPPPRPGTVSRRRWATFPAGGFGREIAALIVDFLARHRREG